MGILLAFVFGFIWLSESEMFPIIKKLHDNQNWLYGLLLYIGGLAIGLPPIVIIQYVGTFFIELYKKVFKKN